MFIISFSVGTSILLLPLGQYNQITQVCWIIGYPSGCGNSSNIRSNIPCVRGNWSWNYGILLFYGPLWLCVVLTIIAMANIYLVLRATHTRMQRYSTQALNAMESNGTKIGNTTSEDRKSSGLFNKDATPMLSWSRTKPFCTPCRFSLRGCLPLRGRSLTGSMWALSGLIFRRPFASPCKAFGTVLCLSNTGQAAAIGSVSFYGKLLSALLAILIARALWHQQPPSGSPDLSRLSLPRQNHGTGTH